MRKNRIVLYIISIAILVLMAVGTTFCEQGEQGEQKEINISELYKEIELFSDGISFWQQIRLLLFRFSGISISRSIWSLITVVFRNCFTDK